MFCGKKFQQTLKVVVITSLCWCILDVMLIQYFSECANSPKPLPKQDHPKHEVPARAEDAKAEKKPLLNRILEQGKGESKQESLGWIHLFMKIYYTIHVHA